MTHLSSVCIIAIGVIAATSVRAQEPADDPQMDRGPRFLLASAGGHGRVPVDVRRTPSLRRRISVTFEGTTLGGALEEISRQGGLRLFYSRETVALDLLVHLRAENITVAGALSEVLLDAGVDVLITPDGRAALVRRGTSGGQQGGSIAGRVTDAKTGDALAAAEVLLEGTSWRAMTDDAGDYRLADVAPGTYRVAARRIGYGRARQQVTVTQGQETRGDFALDPAPTQLEELVVAGTLVPTEVRAIPTPVTIVTADEIQTQHLRRVDQVFRSNVPGSFSWDQGADDIVNSVNVRGTNSLVLPAAGIKTYVDGVEVANDAFTLVDVKSIDRIEILRGPEASTLYGSGATGGVMQIFTTKGDLGSRPPRVEASASAGAVESPYESAVDQEYSASVGGGTPSTSYSLGGSYQRTGEWVPEYHLRVPSGYGTLRLAQDKLAVQLSARYASRNVGQRQNPILRDAGYAPFQVPSDAVNINRNQTYSVGLSYAATPKWQHNAIVGFDGFAFEYFNTRPRASDSLFDRIINQNEGKVSLRYNTSATLPLSAALSAVLTSGVDYYHFNSSYVGAFSTRTNEGTILGDSPAFITRGQGSNTGIFAQARLDVSDAVFLTAGVRSEWNSAFGTDYGSAVNPRAGISLVRDLGPVTAKLRGSYGEALRPPAYGSNIDQPGLRSNPELGPEEQVGGEAGLDLYFGANAAFSVTYYRQTARGLIDAVLIDATTDPPTYQFQNVGRIRNSGVELEGRLKPGRLDLSANYSITHSTVREVGEVYTGDLQVGDQLLGIPRRTAGLHASYTLGRGTVLSAGLTHLAGWTNPDYQALYGFFFGGQEFRGSTRDYWMEYPSITKVNAGLQQGVGERLTLLLAVENLTNNQRFEQYNVNVIPGRRTMVGLRWN